MNAEAVGRAACELGAGRKTKNDKIDFAAGIVLRKKTGDFVRRGEEIAYLHTNRAEKLGEAEEMYLSALDFSTKPVEREPLVYKIIQ